jgi:hypothetical protein
VKGLTIEVFQDIHGRWAWEIFKADSGLLVQIPFAEDSYGKVVTTKFSGSETTLAKAATAAGKQYGTIAAYEVDCQLREAYREARPVATVMT